jgi:hypothetical protein
MIDGDVGDVGNEGNVTGDLARLFLKWKQKYLPLAVQVQMPTNHVIVALW